MPTIQRRSTRRFGSEVFVTSVLGIVIVRVRVRPVSAIADEFGFLSMSIPGTNRPVLSSSPSPEARENESKKQDTASRGQGNNRNEQILLLSLEVIKLLGIWRGGGVTVCRNRIFDVRSLDTLRGEEFRAIGIDSADGVVTCRANTVDKEVRDDVLGASRLLCETQVTVTVLFDEGGAVT